MEPHGWNRTEAKPPQGRDERGLLPLLLFLPRPELSDTIIYEPEMRALLGTKEFVFFFLITLEPRVE